MRQQSRWDYFESENLADCDHSAEPHRLFAPLQVAEEAHRDTSERCEVFLPQGKRESARTDAAAKFTSDLGGFRVTSDSGFRFTIVRG